VSDDARHLNTLASWLGPREEPSPADVLVLFGGSPPEGWDIAAELFKAGLARHLLLVGGAGHTTPMLRTSLGRRYPDLAAPDAPEADMMADYLAVEHGITGCLLERASTNCGNNITLAEQTLRTAGLTPETMIFIQDASMQRRMDAVARRVWTLGHPRIINHAGTRPRFEIKNGLLAYATSPHWGAWDVDHCIRLLMGEVPRLSPDGYGPRGLDYLIHIDIPADVQAAFTALEPRYGTRPAL
jgi:hypothetical protein